MSKHIQGIEVVNNKYNQLLEKENGQFTQLDVIKVTIPKKMIHDFHYCGEDTYFLTAKELVLKIFTNAKIVFDDVDEVLITYNIVKQG